MKRIVYLALALVLAMCMAGCGKAENVKADDYLKDVPAVQNWKDNDTSKILGLEDGVLTVGMDCANAPYNWTQTNDRYDAVPISNVEDAYANGYDVMIAKRICDTYGWKLEIVSSDWDDLVPAVQAKTVDISIAGQPMSPEYMKKVNMAGPYYYATIVCLTTKDSRYANAKSIDDLAGGKCTAQSGTVWYDFCLPQIQDAQLIASAETGAAALTQLQDKTVDFICTDMPTAMGAVAEDENLVILNFSGTEGDFLFASEDARAEHVNIGISVLKGNGELTSLINKALSNLNEKHFNALMDYAIAIQSDI